MGRHRAEGGPTRAGSGAISVIIPTAGRTSRALLLARAIDSVRNQTGVSAIPIVVLNGTKHDPDLAESLSCRQDIRYVYHPEASLPAALRIGRDRVDTEFFAELDDDDELLPAGLSARLSVLQDDDSAALVVTKGYLRDGERRWLNIADFGAIEKDPVAALMRESWLPSCAGLFRSDLVGAGIFDDVPRYLEWTYIALRLALTRKVRFLDQPTFVCSIDTAGSLSKSSGYLLGQIAAINRMLEMDVPAPIRRQLRAKLAASMHNASTYQLAHGHHLAAWRSHLLSLLEPGGYRYAAYTRHLLAPLLGIGRRSSDRDQARTSS